MKCPFSVMSFYFYQQQSANAVTAKITVSSSCNECRVADLPANHKRYEFWMQSSVLPNFAHMLCCSHIGIFQLSGLLRNNITLGN